MTVYYPVPRMQDLQLQPILWRHLTMLMGESRHWSEHARRFHPMGSYNQNGHPWGWGRSSVGRPGQAKSEKHSLSSIYSSCEFHLKQRSAACINQLNSGVAEYMVGYFFMVNNHFKLPLHHNRILSGLHKLHAPGCTSHPNFAHFRSATRLTTRSASYI